MDRYINVNIIVINWAAVFDFAILLVTKDSPPFFILILNNVTKRSLKIMIATIQISIKPNTANDIKAEEAKILSASGSKNLPDSETALYLLA